MNLKHESLTVFFLSLLAAGSAAGIPLGWTMILADPIPEPDPERNTYIFVNETTGERVSLYLSSAGALDRGWKPGKLDVLPAVPAPAASSSGETASSLCTSEGAASPASSAASLCQSPSAPASAPEADPGQQAGAPAATGSDKGAGTAAAAGSEELGETEGSAGNSSPSPENQEAGKQQDDGASPAASGSAAETGASEGSTASAAADGGSGSSVTGSEESAPGNDKSGTGMDSAGADKTDAGKDGNADNGQADTGKDGKVDGSKAGSGNGKQGVAAGKENAAAGKGKDGTGKNGNGKTGNGKDSSAGATAKGGDGKKNARPAKSGGSDSPSPKDGEKAAVSWSRVSLIHDLAKISGCVIRQGTLQDHSDAGRAEAFCDEPGEGGTAHLLVVRNAGDMVVLLDGAGSDFASLDSLMRGLSDEPESSN